jgi:hypothetical protein
MIFKTKISLVLKKSESQSQANFTDFDKDSKQYFHFLYLQYNLVLGVRHLLNANNFVLDCLSLYFNFGILRGLDEEFKSMIDFIFKMIHE